MRKTNLDILNEESWNYVKNTKNKYKLRSVSDYNFILIDLDREQHTFIKTFLSEIEKYFEYNYYGIHDLIQNLKIDLDSIILMTKELFGNEIPLFDYDDDIKAKNIKKIHELQIKYKVFPRELYIAHNLRNFVEKKQIQSFLKNLDSEKFKIPLTRLGGIKEILDIILPDEEERRKEVYSNTITYAEELIEEFKDKGFQLEECLTCKDCILDKPSYVYYNIGIEVDKEDIEEDLISVILKPIFKEKFSRFYSISLVIAVNSIIQENLIAVKNFIEEQLNYMLSNDVNIDIFIAIFLKVVEEETRELSREEDELFKRIRKYLPDLKEFLPSVSNLLLNNH